MAKVTFRFEEGEPVVTYATEGERLLEVAQKSNVPIDAPCSGEGMFRRDKAMVKDWLQKGPDYYVPIQRKLLLDAADMLKKGGMLLYSTCTFSVKENEENIAYLLQERPDMELLMPEWDEYFSHGKKEGFENCIRIFPHLAPGEGHFAALLGKRTDGEEQSEKCLKKPAKSKKTPVSDLKDCPEFAVFMQQITKPLSGKTEVQKERIYLLPEGTKIERGIRYLRTGLYLGDQKKKRFEPSQALAMCLKAEDFKDIWWIGDYSDENSGDSAGFIAIKIMNALSTGGFKVKSDDKAKGNFDFEYTGHYSIENIETVPYEVYIKTGEAA